MKTSTPSKQFILGVPWHLPDARWQIATWIVEHGRNATVKRDGLLVQRATRYIRLMGRATSERGIRRAAKRFPDIFLACKVANEPTRRVLEIKARTLAGQSDHRIARAVGLPEPTVAAYLGLFFDVRENLQATSWMHSQVLGLSLTEPPGPETLMLLQCWRGGPGRVEPWLDYLEHQGESHDLTTENGLRRARIELFVAAQQLGEESTVDKSLIRNTLFLHQLVAKTIKPATIRAGFERNRAAILSGIAWSEEPDHSAYKPQPAPRAKKKAHPREAGKFARVG